MGEVDNTLYIYHEGEYVGCVSRARNDMWYMEGEWIAEESEGGHHFSHLLMAQDVQSNFREGGGVLVKWTTAKGEEMHDGLAMGLIDRVAVVRMLQRGTADLLREEL